MSKDKYPSIFSPQMVAIVFIILQMFLATRAVLKLGNNRSRDVFRPIARERKYLMDYNMTYYTKSLTRLKKKTGKAYMY